MATASDTFRLSTAFPEVRLKGSEAGFLAPLWEIVESGRTLAERHLEKFHGEWAGNVDRIWDEARF